MTRDNASHAWLSLSLSVFVSASHSICLSIHWQQFLLSLFCKQMQNLTLKFDHICILLLFFFFRRPKRAFTHFLTSYSTHTPFPTLLSSLLTSSCCILYGEAGTGLSELSCTDVFDSSTEVSWVSYMCGVDHLLPHSVYWTVKPGGHRPSWAYSEAPHSHQKRTHFMKNNTNNHSPKHFLSHSTADQVCVILFFILQYWSPWCLINANPKQSSAFSKWHT